MKSFPINTCLNPYLDLLMEVLYIPRHEENSPCVAECSSVVGGAILNTLNHFVS